MSWAITLAGKPAAIKKALSERVAELVGDDKKDMQAALPKLHRVLESIPFTEEERASAGNVIQFSAIGHGSGAATVSVTFNWDAPKDA